MKVVIQCAASKMPGAKCIVDDEGKPVLFVARPEFAPADGKYRYAHPDDPAGDGRTWRQLLIDYNKDPDSRSWNLSPAYRLYRNPVYGLLVEKFGASNVFILSAGWGLIGAEFLTPSYDITFSASAPKYKRRGRREDYSDLYMLPGDSADELVFFGGKDYRPLFCKLTQEYKGARIIFYNSAVAPNALGCTFIRYPTSARTNWHYACAADFIAGRIGLDA